MIGLLSSGSEAHKYVKSAFIRSFTSSQIKDIEITTSSITGDIGVLVLISPSEEEMQLAINSESIQKIIVFGSLPLSLSERFRFTLSDFPSDQWGRSSNAMTYHYAESKEKIQYTDLAKNYFGDIKDRPLERFDFMDEWNNLGFGAVGTKNDIWSVTSPITFYENVISNISDNENVVCTYSALWESKGKSFLWFNREVGPIDSYEWQLVEKYISSYHCERAICYPVLLEVPCGYDCAVTMRLDCDEDIESSRRLWQLYLKEKVPFSLAIHTSNLSDSKHYSLINEVKDSGGAILSHTATHAPNWGGSYESALQEAKVSSELIESVIGESVRYAVSPFHHTPIYALQALSDAGYLGCIGGIIKNDPEFLTYNGGNLPDLPDTFIAHSQQVMLHGDCLLTKELDPLRIYKESFNLSKQSNTIFGYLDHPFSDRYQYGWDTEEQRCSMHFQLLHFIRENTEIPCFFNEIDAMEFLQDKVNIELYLENNTPKMRFKSGYQHISKYIPKIMFKNEFIEVELCE